MSGYLLDTNIVSELRKGRRADAAVVDWFDSCSSTDLWLSVLTIGELRRGVARLERRDARAAAAIGEWLDSIVLDFSDRLLAITTAIATRWAQLGIDQPVPVIDGLLAATALEHDLVLVTRNVADVARTDVEVLNPFGEP